jgi:hypothetical protein
MKMSLLDGGGRRSVHREARLLRRRLRHRGGRRSLRPALSRPRRLRRPPSAPSRASAPPSSAMDQLFLLFETFGLGQCASLRASSSSRCPARGTQKSIQLAVFNMVTSNAAGADEQHLHSDASSTPKTFFFRSASRLRTRAASSNSRLRACSSIFFSSVLISRAICFSDIAS